MGLQVPPPAPQSARQAPSAKAVRLRAHQRAFRSPFLEAFGPRKLRNLSPWGDISTTRAAVGASCSLTGSCFRQSCHVMPLAGGFPLAPCTPSVRPLKITPMGQQILLRAGVGASSPWQTFLTAKLSLNDTSRELSARPLHPFGSSSENNAYGTASPTPAPESARQAPPKNIPAPECPHKKAEAAHSAPLPLSHLFQGIKLPAPVDLPREPLRHRPGDKVRRAADRLVLAERVRHGVDK